MSNGQARSDWKWSVWWSAVYAANLPVALFFGWIATEQGGRLGMAAGIAVLWTVGLAVCAWPGRLRQILVVGGWVVALSQMIVLPHIFIGTFALGSWGSITGANSGIDGPLTEVGGFAVTLMTGQPLMLLALVIGCLMYWLWPSIAEDAPQADD